MWVNTASILWGQSGGKGGACLDDVVASDADARIVPGLSTIHTMRFKPLYFVFILYSRRVLDPAPDGADGADGAWAQNTPQLKIVVTAF